MPHIRAVRGIHCAQYRLKHYVGKTPNKIRVDGFSRRVTIELDVMIKLNKNQSGQLKDRIAMERIRNNSPFLI